MAIGFDMWNAKVDAVKDKLPDFQYQYFKNWRPDAPVGDLRGFSYGQQIYSITNKLNEAVKDPVAFAKTMLQKEGGNSATAYINGVKYDASRIKPIADYLRQNGVSTADMQGIVKSGQDNIVKFYQDMADRQSSRGNALDFLLPAVFAFVAPQIGAEIAASLGVSAAAGTAIASTAIQVANGTDIETAIENAVTNAVVQTGSTAVATEINTAMSNLPPQTAAAISNAAGSALASAATTAAKGGSTQEIINNAVAGAAGSAASSATDSTAVGGAVTGGLTGGATGAALGAAGALGREAATTSTPTTTPSDTQAVIPQGVQVAGELSPETFSVEVGGTPIYADTPQAASYTAPFGYRLMTMAEADAKPEGAFYDPTTNAWLVPDTAAVTGLAESITAPLEPVTTPTTAPISITSGADVGIATPQDTGTPTGPAPQGILIPDQITQVSGGSAGDGGVVGGEGAPSTDQQIMDLTGITAPEAIPTPENIPVLPEVVVTPSPEEPDLQVADATEEPPPEEEPPPKETPPKEVAPEPYKPQFFVAGGVSPRMQSRAPSSALADALQTPFERSLITSGLTSYRGAGEIESPESGGKRRNVWNEASLRLKDALGI